MILHPLKNEATQCEPSVMNKNRLMKVSTHQGLNEAHSQVPNTAAHERFDNASSPLSSRDVLHMGEIKRLKRAIKVSECPDEHSTVAEECLLRHSTDTQQFALKQVLSTNSLGEMEEKRRADAVISKINKGTLTPRSPQSLPDVTLPACSHLPQVEMTSPRHLFTYRIVDSEDDGNAFPAVKSSEIG